MELSPQLDCDDVLLRTNSNTPTACAIIWAVMVNLSPSILACRFSTTPSQFGHNPATTFLDADTTANQEGEVIR
jgi:hypothetical protein